MLDFEQLAAWALASQIGLPLAVFCGVSALEVLRPERRRERGRRWPWATNLALEIGNQMLMRWIALYAIAVAALKIIGSPQSNVFELVHHWAGDWAVLAAGCLLLDLLGYLLHRLEHAVFPLWCLHALHHSDVDVDASTAVRHHPLEVLISTALVLPVILMLGVPLWVLPIYGLLAQIMQLVQHANWRMPERAEALLSLVLATPGLHRAHHATDPQYYDTNFGTVLSVWDRLFTTLGPRLPHSGPAASAFGLTDFRDDRYARPVGALLLPFLVRRERAVLAPAPAPVPLPDPTPTL